MAGGCPECLCNLVLLWWAIAPDVVSTVSSPSGRLSVFSYKFVFALFHLSIFSSSDMSVSWILQHLSFFHLSFFHECRTSCLDPAALLTSHCFHLYFLFRNVEPALSHICHVPFSCVVTNVAPVSGLWILLLLSRVPVVLFIHVLPAVRILKGLSLFSFVFA